MTGTRRSVLLVGFHFPPSAESSGHLRLLGFAKYLPTLGWDPVVLTATRNSYSRIDTSSIDSIPEGCRVHRAPALDTRRHLGLFGKYPGFLARPDRWVSWWPAAVCLGVHLIRRHQVSAIWSTYPIMTAHCVAGTLARHTGLPWFADFRDPVSKSVAGKDRATQESQLRWERRVALQASGLIFTTPSAGSAFAARYPQLDAVGRLALIPNGYDAADFEGLPAFSREAGRRPIRFVHSGVLYREGRNPTPFFQALANLRRAGILADGDIAVTLRASGTENDFRAEIAQLGLDGIVTLAPAIPYRDALAEQVGADALLLFQGDEFDEQIPAKAYEYLRAGRPILALVGERGDTRALLRDAGGAVLAPPSDVAAIQSQLATLIEGLRVERTPHPDPKRIATYSREGSAAALASLLDGAVSKVPRTAATRCNRVGAEERAG